MSNLYVIFRNHEPQYHLGFFSVSDARRLEEEFSSSPASLYSVRQITHRADLPELSCFEASVSFDGKVLSCGRIPAEVRCTVSWIAQSKDRAFGRGYTEDEAIETAQRAAREYLNPEPVDED